MTALIKKGEKFQLTAETVKQIYEFDKAYKALRKTEEALKKAIKEEMEANNLIKLETDDIQINYIRSTTRERFRANDFREDFPELYDDYVSITPVSASVRIKVK